MPFSATSRAGENGAKPKKLETGTVRAIYHTDNSAAASVEQAKAGSWGGARNWRDRTSDCITLKQASDLVEATKYAAGVGLPLNRHVTIHWERAGVCDSDAAAATGRFLHLAGDWTRARGGRLAWNWVRESGERKDSHVHILCHFPAGLEWGPMQRRWLKRVTGAPYRAGVIHTARIGGRANAAATAPDLYAVNLAAVVGYVLKGVSPVTAAALGLGRVTPGGRIIGKRAATSQNISRAARARSACEQMLRFKPSPKHYARAGCRASGQSRPRAQGGGRSEALTAD